MFVEIEETPNPATLKFLPGREVMGDYGTADFRRGDAAAIGGSPLAAVLFDIEDVEGVFFGHDFISVTKTDDADWFVIKPMVLGVIMEHLTAGRDVITVNEAQGADDADLDEVSIQIKELIDTRVRPAVAQDGGDIVFDRFDGGEGVVYLHMRGACAGCPSSTMTLKAGIENMLRHYIPEVQEVRPIM